METHELPRTAVLLPCFKKIREVLPFDRLRAYALRESLLGDAAQGSREWNEAIVHYGQCAQSLERFRHPAVLELVSQCYLNMARCALVAERAALSLSLIRQYFLVSEASAESLELARMAKENDVKTCKRIDSLLGSADLTFDDIQSVVEYLIEYPLPKRSAVVEQIIERFRSHAGSGPELLWYLGRCHMVQGRWDAARSLLAPLASENKLIQKHLFR